LIDAAALVALKREHLKRLANQTGAAGEQEVLSANAHLIPRPSGEALSAILWALAENGIKIKKTSFDAIYMPTSMVIEFLEPAQLREVVKTMVFIEIKTANQSRVQPDFSGYFFAFTEGEILAAEALGNRHKVMLLNKLTGATLLTSVPELLARARSTNWQVSVQL